MALKIFLSYNFADQAFVADVHRYLSRQPTISPYFYSQERKAGRFAEELREAQQEAQALVLFLGSQLGEWQRNEVGSWLLRTNVHSLWIQLHPEPDVSGAADFCSGRDPIVPYGPGCALTSTAALTCAEQIVKRLGERWHPYDGLPQGYPFDYEKDIVQAFRRPRGERIADSRLPREWPEVQRWTGRSPVLNPVSPTAIGGYRREDAHVVVDARAKVLGQGSGANDGPQIFTFPEAGPRDELAYPDPANHKLRVGILVAGGIAPGINAVIDGIVSRHFLYADPPSSDRRVIDDQDVYNPYTVEVFGYQEGFKSLLRGAGNHELLSPQEVEQKAHDGGSILGTSRVEELVSEEPDVRDRAIDQVLSTLASERIDILYVIGGDGGMRAAHALSTVARSRGSSLSVVGVPKTMDNDILWVWQSFGFISAVEKAREAINALQTEVRSNPRLCVIQLFGSDSGFVVAHAALASGGCDYALIPEVGFTMKGLCEHMRKVLVERFRCRHSRPHGVIVMSETAIPVDVADYLDSPDLRLSDEEAKAIRKFACLEEYDKETPFRRRVQGQTPDELRTGGLKIVLRVLERELRAIEPERDYWKDFRVFANEPRHILRAIPPSVSDVVFGERLGSLAVDNAMAGYHDFMVSQWLTEYVLVPLELVVLGRKRLPTDGIFWKSVLASTKQPVERLDAESGGA